MSEPIETCPVGIDVLLYFPDFERWTIGTRRVTRGYGLDLDEYVDQWNEDEFELSDSTIRPLPTHWQNLPEPPQ